MSHLQNITRIKAVYAALEEIADNVIFVGGAAVSLYADRPFTESRPTSDVDIVVELLNYNEFADIEKKLRSKGFVNDTESGIICRYSIQGIIVDVMPTSHQVLGFANKWYPEAFAKAYQIQIDRSIRIKVFDPVYFIATKMEAFKGRGKSDGRFSTDFEDIVFILNKRNTIWHELKEAPASVSPYLKKSFRELLSEKYFEEWLSAHIDFNEQTRVNFIIKSLKELVV